MLITRVMLDVLDSVYKTGIYNYLVDCEWTFKHMVRPTSPNYSLSYHFVIKT